MGIALLFFTFNTDSERQKQLDAVLLSYNLTATVHFPSRVENLSTRVVRKVRFPMIFHTEKHVYWH
jgi:hypothetical protein